MAFEFKKAVKSGDLKLRLALIGASGSGKTYSALKIAFGLGRRVALIDTEHESASKYADAFDFATLPLTDFDPDNYVKGIAAAERAGFDVLVIDSLTHAWAGTGGLLEQKDKRGGNSFEAWRTLTPKHNALVDAILAAKLHVIATIRAKQQYEVERDDKGKVSIKKLGLGAVQREGMEYEFDVVGSMDEADLTITKTRYSKITGRTIRRPDESLGRELASWLSSGQAPAAPPATQPVAAESPDEAALLEEKLRSATTLEELASASRLVSLAKPRLAPAQAEALRAAYSERRAALSPPPNGEARS